MNKRCVYSVCSSGLANRLRAYSGAWRLSRLTNRILRLQWSNNQWCGCNWRDLFDTDVCVIDNECVEKELFLCDWTAKIYNATTHDYLRVIKDDPEDVIVLKSWSYPYLEGEGNHIVKDDCIAFLRELEPVLPIQRQVELFSATFPSKTVGMHIRRGDPKPGNMEELIHEHYFVDSTDDAFLRKAQQATDEGSHIFLATNNLKMENRLKDNFKDKIITFPKVWEDRFTRQGMQDALTELLLLGCTSRVVGTTNSQYSQLAADLADIPLEIA